jgi:hypothetical protein
LQQALCALEERRDFFFTRLRLQLNVDCDLWYVSSPGYLECGMAADGFFKLRLHSQEALIKRCRILLVCDDHLCAGLSATDDLESIGFDAGDQRIRNCCRRLAGKPSSGPAFDDCIIGVSVAAG